MHRAAVRLEALSPLKVLARGYAIATRDDGRAIRSGDDVRPGDIIQIRVSDASIEADVQRIDQPSLHGKSR
jgi:exodeoxyribonuclease VII large subunit